MKNPTKVTPEAYKSIIENAAWAQFGVNRTLAKKLDEVKEEPKTESKDKKPVNESKETVEKHVCPLCETELKNPISDEKLLEHASNMVDVFSEAEEELLNEESEDDEESEEEDSDEEEESEDESEDEEEEVETDEEEE